MVYIVINFVEHCAPSVRKLGECLTAMNAEIFAKCAMRNFWSIKIGVLSIKTLRRSPLNVSFYPTEPAYHLSMSLSKDGTIFWWLDTFCVLLNGTLLRKILWGSVFFVRLKSCYVSGSKANMVYIVINFVEHCAPSVRKLVECLTAKAAKTYAKFAMRNFWSIKIGVISI